MASECRICGEQIFTPNPKNIFERRNRRILLAIKQVTGLELKFETLLPMHICSCCLLDLSHAIAFRQRCLQTDVQLHSKTTSSLSSRVIAELDPLMKVNNAVKEVEEQQEEATDDEEEEEPKAKAFKFPMPIKEIKREPQEHSKRQIPRVMLKRLHVHKRDPMVVAATQDQIARKPKKADPRINSQDKRYVCDQCGWSFSDLSNMKDHKLRHYDEKFICDECGRKFYTQPTLKMHIRVIHKGEKPFICKFCGMGFGNSPTRCRHERQFHSNQLQFKCDVCGKKFNSDKGRLKHQATHKNGMPDVHYCDPCHRQFKSGECLRRHYLTKYHRKRANRLMDDSTYQAEDQEEEDNYEDQDEGQDDPADYLEYEPEEEEEFEEQDMEEEMLDDEAEYEDFEYEDAIMEELQD
ncbi:hypothetical protein KR009_011492 [Drosophila setifemur]|nr:hypothetical protein KR009_011492 [Drosophila setifemur]